MPKLHYLPGENDPGYARSITTGGFLSHASLEAGDNQAQAGQDAIQLMTVHSAKGLGVHRCLYYGPRGRIVSAREQCE
jgi:hypothetical protein